MTLLRPVAQCVKQRSPLGPVKLVPVCGHLGHGALQRPAAHADAIGRAQDARPVKALFTMHEHRPPCRFSHDRQKPLEDVGRRGRAVGEGQVFEPDPVLSAPRLLPPKPAAAQRVSRPAARADDRAQPVPSAHPFQVADSRLPAAQQDPRLYDVKMRQSVVAAADQPGEPQAPLVGIAPPPARPWRVRIAHAGPIRVPTRSPSTTRRNIPGLKRLKTITGSLYCSHISAAPMSITRSRPLMTC